MKKYLRLGFILLIFFIVHQDAFSQRKRTRKSKRTEVKAETVQKLTQIELEKGKNKYPLSYFRKIKKDSLLIYASIEHQDNSVTYQKKSVLLTDFDYIKITNRKERFKKSLLCGLGVGALTYFATQRRAKSPETIRSQGSSGIVEGLNIGLIGFGVGIIVYNQVLHKKLSIEDQKKYIVKKLKSF